MIANVTVHTDGRFSNIRPAHGRSRCALVVPRFIQSVDSYQMGVRGKSEHRDEGRSPFTMAILV